MKYIKHIVPLLALLLLILNACSKLRDDITSPPKVTVHGEGSLDTASSNFHAMALLNDSLKSCQQCHSADYSGGTAQVGCNVTACHPTISVHQTDNIVSPQSPNFHGAYISQYNLVISDCANCHQTDYSGGIVSAACNNSNCHPTINVHVDGILTAASPNFHGEFLKNANWNILDCRKCHGTDYSGQIASTSCTNSGCHTSTNGPEACNTCHGNFEVDSLIAPPQALNDEIVTIDAGVGAHTEHLFANLLRVSIPCNECHLVPQQFDSQGHIDNTVGAELIFGNLATSYGAAPLYDVNNFTCTDSYCHGNFELLKDSSQYAFAYAPGADKIEGNNYNPVWNFVNGTQAVCGTCHNLPPTGHAASALSGCDNCHVGVIDNDGNIIDKTKHINGVVNVFGN